MNPPLKKTIVTQGAEFMIDSACAKPNSPLAAGDAIYIMPKSIRNYCGGKLPQRSSRILNASLLSNSD